MEISRLKISNFRSIKEADIQFGAVTVLIGTNKDGKSAILEAIRIALTRRWGQRGNGFTEYDVHLCDGRPDPKVGDPVVTEVELQEDVANEWPEDLRGELEDIIQLDPVTGRASIIMRVSCSWEAAEESFVPRWEFLKSIGTHSPGAAPALSISRNFSSFCPSSTLKRSATSRTSFPQGASSGASCFEQCKSLNLSSGNQSVSSIF